MTQKTQRVENRRTKIYHEMQSIQFQPEIDENSHLANYLPIFGRIASTLDNSRHLLFRFVCVCVRFFT